MDAWWSRILGLLVAFFNRPTAAEAYLVLALCVLLGALALSRVSNLLGALRAFYVTAFVLTPLGLILLVAALVYPPMLAMGAFVATLTFLVVLVPVTVLLFRGSYISALVAWVVTLLVVGAVLTQEPRLKRSFDDLKQQWESGKLFDLRQTKTELWK